MRVDLRIPRQGSEWSLATALSFKLNAVTHHIWPGHTL